MRLSVITINLNNAEGLQKTIKSVIEQTYKEIEYIIIDGGSTDGSLDVIKKYEDRITYWISEPDNGIYNAMNKGITKTHGEYVQFLNSGDWLVNNRIIEKLLGDLNDCDLLYGNIIEVYPGGKTRINYGTKGADISLFTFYIGTLTHPAAFIRKKLFTKYGYYDERLKVVSDWKFYLIAFGLNQAKAIYKNFEICYFDIAGISSTRKDLASIERETVFSELVSFSIIEFFKNNEIELQRLEFIKRFKLTFWLNSIIQCALVIISKLLDRINNLRNFFLN